MDLGQRRRGVDMGPSAVRYAGLGDHLTALGFTVYDAGNVSVPVPEMTHHDTPSARHLASIAQVLTEVYAHSQRVAQAGDIGIFLGGDHSVSAGTIAGLSGGDQLGVIWVDAHADFNTPQTSPSGNVHGMPLAALLGYGPPELVDLGRPGRKLDPSRVVLVGVRSLDPDERVRLRESGAGVYTMRDIDERGVAQVAGEVIRRLGHVDRVHVSLDLDALDPTVAPGVGTPVRGGLTYREAHLLMEILADTGRVRSLDLVEINPILDQGNRTAEMAVELASSLLGQTIW
ncbi:MAG: arginase [Anaerolineae bacterium]|nr:arginase [Anaerolineae bacterium]